MKCRRRFISASGVRLMSKKEKSPEKKKNRKKKVLRVLGCILAFILVFAIVTTCVSLVGIKSNTNKAKSFPAVGCDLSFENAGNGVWNIRYNFRNHFSTFFGRKNAVFFRIYDNQNDYFIKQFRRSFYYIKMSESDRVETARTNRNFHVVVLLDFKIETRVRIFYIP